jgi:hypothetical protein
MSQIPPSFEGHFQNHANRIYALERRIIQIDTDDYYFVQGTVTITGSGYSTATATFSPVRFPDQPFPTLTLETPAAALLASDSFFAGVTGWTQDSDGSYTQAALAFVSTYSGIYTYHWQFAGFA